MQLRSFKSSLLGARCPGCGGKQLTGVGCAAQSQLGRGSQPGPGTDCAWSPCVRPGAQEARSTLLFPLFEPKRCELWDPAVQPRAVFPSQVFPSWAPGCGMGGGTQWHVRCPVICHHRAQQISAWPAQISGKPSVSAGCNVSSGTSGAASTFYLGSARGAALPRHRGWLSLMLMHPRFGSVEGAPFLERHKLGPSNSDPSRDHPC